jgi:hypothetical protein
VAIVGGGWAGLAAAVEACAAGHRVALLEAARTLGGRARTVAVPQGGADDLLLDNGQHILIGAYAETLALMRRVGVAPEAVLARLPLALVFPDGGGLRMPDLPAPWNVLLGVLGAGGWNRADRWSLIRTALGWRLRGFACPADATVRQLCARITPRVMEQLIEPLCVSALNTPAAEASGAVFLRVLRDALFGPRGSADLLLPRADLGALLPDPAAAWLQAHGARIETGRRVAALSDGPDGCWRVDGEIFDRVILACPPGEAQRLLSGVLPSATAAWPPGGPGRSAGLPEGGGRLSERSAAYGDPPWRSTVERWIEAASRLRFEAIATVYLRPAADRGVAVEAGGSEASEVASGAGEGIGGGAGGAGGGAGGAGGAESIVDARSDSDASSDPGVDRAPGFESGTRTGTGPASDSDAGLDSEPIANVGPDVGVGAGADPGTDAAAAAAGDPGPVDAPRRAADTGLGPDAPASAADAAPGPPVPRLPAPMLALHAGPDAPAQFVFDRGQLGGPAGLLAFVVSASTGERDRIAAQVLRQAADQLGLDAARLTVALTVVEKRATFACTPGLARPGPRIAPGLLACGDYLDGPYPATLEGAVRSGRQAAALL